MKLADIALDVQKKMSERTLFNLKPVQVEFMVEHAKLKTEFLTVLKSAESVEGELDGVIEMLEKSSFFRDPASAKYHNAFYGGLLDHCMNVYVVLKSKAEMYDLNIPTQQLIRASLLHDVCKIGNYNTTAAWRKDSTNKWEAYPGYGYLPDNFPMGHGEKSLALLTELIPLTRDEQLAIRWHSGPFEDGKAHDFTRAALASNLVPLLHTADFEASILLESQGTIEWLINM